MDLEVRRLHGDGSSALIAKERKRFLINLRIRRLYDEGSNALMAKERDSLRTSEYDVFMTKDPSVAVLLAPHTHVQDTPSDHLYITNSFLPRNSGLMTCWNSQVAGNMRCIGCRVNNSARWLIYTCEPYRAGGSNSNTLEKDLLRIQTLLSTAESDDVDALQTAADESYEQAFAKADGGTQWHFHQESDPHAMPSPTDIETLNSLNLNQQIYDKAVGSCSC